MVGRGIRIDGCVFSKRVMVYIEVRWVCKTSGRRSRKSGVCGRSRQTSMWAVKSYVGLKSRRPFPLLGQMHSLRVTAANQWLLFRQNQYSRRLSKCYGSRLSPLCTWYFTTRIKVLLGQFLFWLSGINNRYLREIFDIIIKLGNCLTPGIECNLWHIAFAASNRTHVAHKNSPG